MIDDDINKKYKNIKDQLDRVSDSFCIAKWKQVTVHLDTGMTHSCHHPITHKIPIEEIKVNSTAIHNTNFKKQQRKLMLEGKRPEECDYCWRVEDNAKNSQTITFSDRIVKSTTSWAQNTISDIVNKGWDHNTVPGSMEINFGSTCNLKCAYCNPEISSKWMEEIKHYGAYKLEQLDYNGLEWLAQNDRIPIPHKEYNPYVDAFWKWWPELVKDLKVFRITGGEPLLNKNTFKILDYLIDNPHPDLSLSINSNLAVPKKIIQDFINKMQIIQDKNCVKEFKLYTSCEAHGAKAEYIRFGLNYNIWLSNCESIIKEIPNSRLGLMATYNALSVTSFQSLLEDMLILKNTYTIQPQRPHTVSIDIPYLRWPEFMTAWLVPPNWLSHIENTVTFMYKNLQQTYWPPLCGKGFFDHEIKKMERIYMVCKEEFKNANPKNALNRKNLRQFITEHDKRRGTNFQETFPEFEFIYQNK